MFRRGEGREWVGGQAASAIQVASLAEPPAVCRPPLEGGFSPEQGGFWGPHGHIVSSLAECRTLDFRPGLLLLHHLSPANLSQPDQVIRASCFPAAPPSFATARRVPPVTRGGGRPRILLPRGKPRLRVGLRPCVGHLR